MLVRILPPLRVHCWGGLGSQLFAWALIEEIKNKYPKRRVKLILHQSGVTKRVAEIAEFFPGEFSIREDFNAQDSLIVNQPVLEFLTLSKNLVKNMFVKFLTMIGALCTCDSDTNLKSLRIWTIQIRGHYSYRKISKEVIESMNSRAELVGKCFLEVSDILNSDIAIQYRLGDLLTIDKKSPVNPSRIAKSIVSVETFHPVKKLVVFSDSLDVALHRLSPFAKKIEGRNTSAWNTLRELQNFRYFIATNSKISVWAILIRVYFSPDLINFAPVEFRDQLESNLYPKSVAEHIEYY